MISLLSAQESKKQKLTIGIGPYVQTQAYKNADALFVPSPVIFFDNSLFYVRWSRGGIYFLGDKQEDYAWGFSLTAQPRPYGYRAEDSNYLKGMDTRRKTLEGGLAFSATYNDAYLEIMALTDVLDRYDSWLLRLEIGDKYTYGDFSFFPSFIVMYESKEFVDYYYGVKASEVDTSINRFHYKPGAGFQLGVQSFINYSLDDEWSILANLRVDRLSNDAANSPLVDQAYISSALLSLIYTFEY